MAAPSTITVSKTPTSNPLAQTMLGYTDSSLNFSPGYVAYDIETLTVQTPALDSSVQALVTATATANGALAAIETNQTTGLTFLAEIYSTAQTLATATLQSAANTVLGNILTKLGSVVLGVGSAIIGKVGIDQTAPGTTNGVVINAALPAGGNIIGTVNTGANTSGGASTYSAQGGTSAALLTGSAVLVSAGAHNVYGFDFDNTQGAADAFVQIFDAASAGAVTPGTTVPKWVCWVPQGGGRDKLFPDEAKMAFASGIVIAATTTRTGAGAPVVGVAGNILFK